MMSTYVQAKQFFLPMEVTGPGYLEITADGKFGDFLRDIPDGSDVIDYGSFSIAPGLVDTHIHGYQGHDVMDNDPEGLKVMAEALPSCGVTSWLPTTLTASRELLADVCRTVGENAEAFEGAKIRGIFLEGPFFSEEHKGAQNPKYMGDPDISALEEWVEASKGYVKKIGIAPEREGAVDFTKQATQLGVAVGIGHTSATFDECEAVINAGANIFVHAYNGMRGLNHREPGVVGAAMFFKDAYDELICDGHHVHPVAAKVLLDAHGRKRTMLITDCMRAGGLGEGESHLGEYKVIVKDGAARLADSGNLAGSILQLIDGVKNVVKWQIASPAEAIRMASQVPAESVKIDDVCGKIAPGYAADFIVLEDDMSLVATYLDGKLAYDAEA